MHVEPLGGLTLGARVGQELEAVCLTSVILDAASHDAFDLGLDLATASDEQDGQGDECARGDRRLGLEQAPAGADVEDLAERFACTEKTVKREYLRSLATLLGHASAEVFGERVPSSFVRRMMRTLNTIVREKDLKIRDNAGRGLGKIVERWEIALRFVLNHAHRGATVATGRIAGEAEAS